MTMAKPLDGIQVLDISRILAGPLTTQWLADLGADVIKIERPETGDESRLYGPPFLDSQPQEKGGMSGFYLSCNRNKKSVTLDIGSKQGQKIIRDLAVQSDVLVENFRVGALKKYGLDYESIKAVNDKLIYCSITGFGQDGPYKHRPGYDGIFQSLGGLASVSGHADDQPGGGPMKVGISIVDVMSSYQAAFAVVAALYHRDAQGGGGQHIDLSLLDVCVATLSHYAQNYLITGNVPKRRGNAGYGGVPSQTFQCADGIIFLTAGNDQQYGRLCQAIGRPELIDAPLFKSNILRTANREALSETLDTTFTTQPVGFWLEVLERAEVPAGPVNTIDQVFEDPQVRHRQLLRHAVHPKFGNVPTIANALRFSETPVDTYNAPPELGADTRTVLHERLGLDEAACDQLAADGVI
jgi:crotonobetainyl-CoA:carnitine CoA-transferase CaiB-like acyl-CoA transferase